MAGFFTGKGRRGGRDDSELRLPEPFRVRLGRPEAYVVHEALADAVNVSMLLGQPLLLTGEPGTGKTSLAYAIGHELGLETLKFETKSTSVARDLFYVYDTVGRFQASQSGKNDLDPASFITYNALGKAILLANDRKDVVSLLPANFPANSQWQRRCVVLVDEVDKAPRDFPNDILNEIEGMYFRVPELGNREVKADPNRSPIVVITSNSEKHLPDAFLRRCVFYNIDFPGRAAMRTIIEKTLGEAGDTAFYESALGLFYELRDGRPGLNKKPSTAELLGWILALKDSFPESANPLKREHETKILNSLSVLIKNSEDMPQAVKIAQKWLARG